mmetsp:Transcript_105252/g.181498  ORF Transcript_105252/g.181498 Transcript_105252/m.181498 type:complete len:218 (+) Transcript_105252:1728-2381(+)
MRPSAFLGALGEEGLLRPLLVVADFYGFQNPHLCPRRCQNSLCLPPFTSSHSGSPPDPGTLTTHARIRTAPRILPTYKPAIHQLPFIAICTQHPTILAISIRFVCLVCLLGSVNILGPAPLPPLLSLPPSLFWPACLKQVCENSLKHHHIRLCASDCLQPFEVLYVSPFLSISISGGVRKRPFEPMFMLSMDPTSSHSVPEIASWPGGCSTGDRHFG